MLLQNGRRAFLLQVLEGIYLLHVRSVVQALAILYQIIEPCLTKA